MIPYLVQDPIYQNIQEKGLHYIKKVLAIEPYTIRAIFCDEQQQEEERLINIHNYIQEMIAGAAARTWFHDLLEEDYFCRGRYDGYATVEWGNGFDICPDILYYYSVPVEISEPLRQIQLNK